MNKEPKVVLSHDYLVQYGGAEKVLEALHEIWPQAPIYTSFVDKKIFSFLKINPKNIKTSFISKFPFSHKFYKHAVPLYPTIFKSTDIGDANVVISSSTFAAKFINKRKAAHICYLHTVPRFLWGYDTELEEPAVFWFDRKLKPLYKKILPPLKAKLKKGVINGT